MPKKKGRLRSLAKLIIGISLLIFVLIIMLKFAELQQIASLLKKVNYGWLFLAVLFQLADFASTACFFKIMFKKRASFGHFFKTAFAMLFVDHTIPSFSVSGNLLLYHSVRKKKVKDGHASLGIALNIFLNFLIFLIIFVIGLVYLLVSMKIFSFHWIWVPITLIVIAFALITRILWTTTGHFHFRSFLEWLLKKWPKAQYKILEKLSHLQDHKKTIKKKTVYLSFAIIAVGYIFRLGVIAMTFLALGNILNPGVLITGYFLASFLSTMSYVRLGVYEASMAGIFTALGINYNLALTATLLYRLVSFWFSMIIGFFCFRHLIDHKEK